MESTVLFARSIEILCCCYVALAVAPSTADAQQQNSAKRGEKAVFEPPSPEETELESFASTIGRNISRARAATVAVQVGSNEASGVFIDKDFVLTTGHATSKIGENATVTLNDGKRLAAIVHGIDRRNDVALLKVSQNVNIEPMRLEERPERSPHYVIAIGHPSGFDGKRKAVIRFGRCFPGDVFQSTCRLVKGDSGGPLFDLFGNVVAIHKQIRRGSDENFHASSESIRANLHKLKDGRVINEPPPPLPRHDLDPGVVPRLGWLPPVVVVHCDGKQTALGTLVKSKDRAVIVTKASELYGKVAIAMGTQTLNARIRKIDVRYDIAVLEPNVAWQFGEPVKAASHTVGTLVVSTLPRSARAKVGIIGANRRRIERDAPAFGVTLDELTITTVAPNSAAKIAKLRVGDELRQFDGTRLKSQADLGSALATLNAGDRFDLLVNRAGKQQQFNIQLLHKANRRFSDDAFQQGAAGPLSLRRSGFPSVRQHDCDIQPNQCGGPLLDFEGRLLGVNIARAGREATYAIPIEIVRKIAELGD